MPAAGPTKREIEKGEKYQQATIQIVDVTDSVARRLISQRTQRTFSETLGAANSVSEFLGSGDVVEVTIWEAPPATLFIGSTIDPRAGLSGARGTTLPEQEIDSDGTITVPFVGKIKIAGKTLSAVGDAIARELARKANQPEVLVRLTRNSSRNATVVGEVNRSLRVPLTPGGERVLDAIAAAGGVRQPVDKTMIQITRGQLVQTLPLQTVIRDPRQNITLQSGDVVTALFEPLSFTALGASGKNQEINFEAQGITLAQALARAGGLTDSLSDPRGVFIFRFEHEDALDWAKLPVTTTPEGLVPVVYRIDLKDPASFFVMQSFAMNNKDVLYVSNAPVTEMQKFLNLVFTIVYPVLNAKQTFGF